MLSPLNCIPDYVVEYWNELCKGEEIYTAYIDDIIYISITDDSSSGLATYFLGKVIYGSLYIYHDDVWLTLKEFDRLFKLKAFW